MKNLYFYKVPVGTIGIAEESSYITDVFFGEYRLEGALLKETALLSEAGLQLHEYFKGKRKTFQLPINLEGTEFMQKVWYALCEIPYAETRSYKDIAVAVGKPNASRAVGRANNRNPISIIVPCHRVIGANGNLVGYGGGLEMKQYLLELERFNKTNRCAI